jgi:hypothetical protein
MVTNPATMAVDQYAVQPNPSSILPPGNHAITPSQEPGMLMVNLGMTAMTALEVGLDASCGGSGD